jgi:accessory gene regulator protein AgrB
LCIKGNIGREKKINILDRIAIKIAKFICRDIEPADLNDIDLSLQDIHELYAYRWMMYIRNYGMLIASISILTVMYGINGILVGLTFVGTFSALRTQFGGTHLESAELCFVVSISIIVLAATCSINMNMSWYISLALLSLSTVYFYITGVRDHENDIKSIEEKKILKKRGMISAVILFAINLLFITVELRTLTNALTLAFVSEVIILGLTKTNVRSIMR